MMAPAMSFGTWTQEKHRTVTLSYGFCFWSGCSVHPSQSPRCLGTPDLSIRTSQQLSWGGASPPGLGTGSFSMPAPTSSPPDLTGCDLASLFPRPPLWPITSSPVPSGSHPQPSQSSSWCSPSPRPPAFIMESSLNVIDRMVVSHQKVLPEQAKA